MYKSLALAALLASGSVALADTAYGSLNNFDVVNDTGQTCYGFLIELDDVRSTDITYTYDWNHYGAPRIMQDDSLPGHPRVFIWHESKRNPDGTFAAFTNPTTPAHPILPTSGHDCTDPTVNFGCEHFGVGLYASPSAIKYNWLVEDPARPGSLIVGPAVTISAPVFVYSPPVPPPVLPQDPPAAPAVVKAVIEPPEPPEPIPGQWGVPVWVKSLKTVQPLGKVIPLEHLVTDDETDPSDDHWDGGEQAETEIEWQVFQKRPPGDENPDEIEGQDELPEPGHMVTRRYEFYVYNGPVNDEDGEAQCDNPDNCPGAVGAYIGSQMAGFNVEAPLGLIDHLQNGELNIPYVDRTVVVGGNKPYSLQLIGTLPLGLDLDPSSGILSGTPLEAGLFSITIEATDSDDAHVAKNYTLLVVAPLAISIANLPNGRELQPYASTLTASGGLPPFLWEADSLPSDLTIAADGKITGTPALSTAGDYAISVTVSDTLGNTDSQIVYLKIDPAPPLKGDLDGDRDVDLNDLAILLAARNQTVPAGDPRDLDGDRKVTLLDARKLTLLFTRPGGAVQ